MPIIVVADDELPIARLIEEVLTEEGFTVYIATDGRQALELAHRVLPDLILCDIMMPLVSGEEVQRALQDDPQTRAIPIILMSAAAVRFGRSKSPNFLPKPFELDQLFSIIERHLGQHH